MNDEYLIGPPATTLPNGAIDRMVLCEMQVGETRYTVPWAMWVREDRTCWLNGEYSTHYVVHGTATLRVQRTEDGYEVWLPPSQTYRPTRQRPWTGSTDAMCIPVHEVHLRQDY